VAGGRSGIIPDDGEAVLPARTVRWNEWSRQALDRFNPQVCGGVDPLVQGLLSGGVATEPGVVRLSRMRGMLRAMWRLFRIIPLAFAGIGPRALPPPPPGPDPTEQVADVETSGDRG
jgi:hypothetical protein